jgi:hypothetical protein
MMFSIYDWEVGMESTAGFFWHNQSKCIFKLRTKSSKTVQHM